MKSLLGMSLQELQELVAQHNMPKFTAKQLLDWLYRKRVKTFDEMTNLSKQIRQVLAENYETGYRDFADVQESKDGTKKYLFPTETGFVETAYIPERERATLCVSCQVGCKMNCLFCMTGKQKYTANLTANEIVNQILALPEFEKLTNIVFMGMGEPCDNLDNVLAAIEILTAEYALGWSPHRITVSSVGIRKGLKRLLDSGDYHIAISLHHPIPEKRAEIMPAEKGFPTTEMLDLLREYDFSHQRRLTFEYIVFKDINETPSHARRLIKLLDGIDCRINLIRYHAIPGVPLEGVNEETMVQFRDTLTKNGLFTTIRASRGEDIFAACGMLSTLKNEQQKNNK